MDKNTQKTKENGTDGTLFNKKEKFIEQLSENLGNATQTCKDLNIGRRTFYHWKEADSGFSERCDNVSEELLDLAENALLSEIKNSESKGHTTAYIFYLKTKGRKRGYDEHHRITIDKPFEKIELEDL